MSPIPQFKVKRLHGVTDIRLPDDPNYRSEFAKAMKEYAPLVSEVNSPAPTFDELKKTHAAFEFIEAQASAGKTFTFQFHVRAQDGRIIEKEAVLLDENQRIWAVSRWRPGEGITFVVSN